MNMDGNKIAERLFARAKESGLVNPVTNMGAPTLEHVAEAIDLVRDSAEVDELATYCRRLIRAVRKTDPNNPVAAKCVEYLREVGQANPMR
jgi:hypothetical protein